MSSALDINQDTIPMPVTDDAWCCPICSTIVEIEGEYTAAGWCNSERCVLARVKRRLFSKPCRGPEIMAAEYRGAEA